MLLAVVWCWCPTVVWVVVDTGRAMLVVDMVEQEVVRRYFKLQSDHCLSEASSPAQRLHPIAALLSGIDSFIINRECML